MESVISRVMKENYDAGFMYGFSESFSKSFTKSFINDFDEMLLQKHTEEVLHLYTKTFTDRFVEIINAYCNEGQLTKIGHDDIIKYANAAEKNGRVILLQLMIEQKILTDHQAIDYLDDDTINIVSLEAYQGNEMLIKELIDKGCITEARAEQLQERNQ